MSLGIYKVVINICELCGNYPCDYRCPNAPEPPIVFYCDECGEPIYEGDTYYQVDLDKYCEDCMNDFKRIAEVEDNWDED
jgi:hypothetical protein